MCVLWYCIWPPLHCQVKPLISEWGPKIKATKNYLDLFVRGTVIGHTTGGIYIETSHIQDKYFTPTQFITPDHQPLKEEDSRWVSQLNFPGWWVISEIYSTWFSRSAIQWVLVTHRSEFLRFLRFLESYFLIVLPVPMFWICFLKKSRKAVDVNSVCHF